MSHIGFEMEQRSEMPLLKNSDAAQQLQIHMFLQEWDMTDIHHMSYHL
jgi:hypothetical protein